MHNILLLSISLIFISISALAKDKEITASCADLGYTTPYDECTQDKGVPLICPVYDGGNEKPVICLKESCRGYNLVDGEALYKDETNWNDLASDGRTIRNHIASFEECTVGTGDTVRKLYRVKECAEGSLYQNGLCDVGCDTVNKYPYRLHPGNLAGEVEVCKDASGEYFGYKECHDGWLGGWNNKDNPTGYCNLNTCDIMYYPYNTDPNAQKVRGTTDICLIGGNRYYKYISCNEGYTLSTKGSVCIGSCEIDIDNCEKTQIDITGTNYNHSYNNWKCGLKDKNTCMIGDNATIDGYVIGTIFYISDDKILVMGGNQGTKKWGDGLAESTNIPTEILPDITSTASAVQDYDGKQKTNAIKAYINKSDNDEFTDASYPAAAACYNYETTNCHHDMCLQGEWYLPALGELGYMYDNRYLLWQVTGQNAFYNSYFWSSTESGSASAWALSFINGNRWSNGKYPSGYVRPVLSF